MTIYLCGGAGLPALDFPDVGEGMCCAGAAYVGPRSCTCWVEVYDLNQADLDHRVGPGLQLSPCADCAYRPSSPERTGDPNHAGDQALLDAIVEEGQPFWCHEGMRRVVAFRHPNGTVWTPPWDVLAPAYRPPIVNGVPYRASGAPALLCAGWASRRLREARP